MEKLNTYFDFAENDFKFFQDAYEHGIKGTPMTAMGQNISERYLKHIICEYAQPQDLQEENNKTAVLKTHSISRLLNYIKKDMGLEIPQNVESDARAVDGFYFSTRYPGDDCFIPTEDDIDVAYKAIKTIRGYTIEFIHEQSISFFSEPEQEDIDAFKHKEEPEDTYILVDGVRAEDIDKEKIDIREQDISQSYTNKDLEKINVYDESDDFEEL